MAVNALTGRRRSRSHQTQELTSDGELANTMMGSQRTRHSQMVHSFGMKEAKRTIGLGMRDGMDANIWNPVRKNTLGRPQSLTSTVGSNSPPNDSVVIDWLWLRLCGSSTFITNPRRPSSRIAPGLGSGLSFADNRYEYRSLNTERREKLTSLRCCCTLFPASRCHERGIGVRASR